MADGVFVTRSIRRLPKGFDVQYFSDLTTCPWDCNYAALGNTMRHAKIVLAPVPTPVLAVDNVVPPPILIPTVPFIRDEAGHDPPTPGLTKAPEIPQAGKRDLDIAGAASSSAKSAKVTPSGDVEASVLGQSSQPSRTPQVIGDSSKPEHERPELDSTPKAPKQMQMQVISFADMREDMDPDLSAKAFGEEVIDSLESFDFELEYDIDWDDGNEMDIPTKDSELIKKLMFPYERNEPNLSDEQLMELDSIADGVEIQRLSSINVLLGSSCLEGSSYKQSPTRFVWTWSDKEMEIGKTARVWLR